MFFFAAESGKGIASTIWHGIVDRAASWRWRWRWQSFPCVVWMMNVHGHLDYLLTGVLAIITFVSIAACVNPTPTSLPASHPCRDGQIKGNYNSGIYHAPGQRDYARTAANVECFDGEAEAIKAGYRKAVR